MSEFLDIVQNFQMALKAQLMYTSNHPRTQAGLDSLAQVLGEWLESRPSIHIAASSGKLFLDGNPFEGKHIHLVAMARQLSERQISGIIFKRGVTSEELQEVLAVLILKPAKLEEAGGAAAILASKHLPHIQLSQTQYKEVREGEGGEDAHGGPATTIKAADPVDQATVAALADLAAALDAAAAAAGIAGAPGQGQGQGSQGQGGQGQGGQGQSQAGQGQDGQGQGGQGLGGQWGQAQGGQGAWGGQSQGGQLGQGQGGLGQGAQGQGGQGQGQGQGQGGQGQGGQSSVAFDLEILTDQWEEQLDLLPEHSLLEDASFAPANLSYLAGTPLSIGMGDSFPQAQQVEGLRQALLKLEPTKLLSVVAGMDSLPSAHPGMRMGFQALAAESFAHASVGLMEGEAWGAARDAMFETLRYAPQQQSMLAALETELRNRGAGAEQMARLQELIQQLDWEGQSMEEKLRQTQEQGRLWQLSLDQRLRFLRRLLDEGRVEGLLSLLEQILEALRQEDVSHREMAAQTLTGIARWMEDPGLPIDAEGPVIEGLSAHFGWEPLAHIHRASTEALAVVIASQVNRDEPGQALALLRELAGLCAFQDSRQEWREAALTSLWETLAEPAFLRRVAELLHTANSETMLTELIPYFEAVGHPAAQLLVEILGNEPDRKRRGRMLEAIRCLGEQALPAVYEGLSSPAWYLVRNTLNLLADMGDASAVEPARTCLAHPDGRVKRAAVRTLYKLGGPASVPPLLAAFPVVDPETQLEIMFAMGQVRAAQAVPALAAFAQDRRNDERLRVRAAETIGQIGDPRSIPVLAELARRRGMIFTSAEPIAVRLAACRALAGLDTPLATETLCELVAAEPWHKDRSVLQQVVNEHRPA